MRDAPVLRLYPEQLPRHPVCWVANNLERRLYEHRQKLAAGFTQRYTVSKLIYFETTESVEAAIAREKEFKGWRRSKKVALIEVSTSYWLDLDKEWEGLTTSEPS